MSILSIIKSAAKEVLGLNEPEEKEAGKVNALQNEQTVVQMKKGEKSDLYVGKKDSDLSDEQKDAVRMQIKECVSSIDAKIKHLLTANGNLDKNDLKEIKKTYESIKAELNTKGLVERLQAVKAFENAIDEQLLLEKKGKISPDANRGELLKQATNNKMEALETGAFDSIEEANKYAKKSALYKAEKALEKMSLDERKQFFDELKAQRNAEIELKVSKLPKHKQGEERTRLLAQQKYEMAQFMVNVAYCKKTDFLLNVVLHLGPEVFDTYSESIVFGIKSRKEGKARTDAADMQDFDYHVNMKQNYAAAGKTVSSEDFEEGVQASAQNQSIDGLNNLNNGINKARENYKKSGILPQGLTKQDLTSMSVAVGAGANLNQNLTVEQKAEFLIKYENALKGYDDSEEVLQRVEQKVQEYISKLPPEERREFELQIKEIKDKKKELALKEKKNADENRKKTVKNVENVENVDNTVAVEENKTPTNSYKRTEYASSPINNSRKNEKSEVAMVKPEQKSISNSSNNEEYAAILRIIGKSENGHEYSFEEIAQEVFTNSALRIYIPSILTEFKGCKDPNYASRMTINAPNEVFYAMLRTLNPITARKYYELQKPIRGFDARIKAEPIIEKDKEQEKKHASC